ncbi:hypothetical protein [Blastococcus sp. SYSU D00813]
MQTWLVVLALWVVLSVLAAVVVGRSIALADRRAPHTGRPLTTGDLPEDFRPASLPIH